jgi:hypothetical protein
MAATFAKSPAGLKIGKELDFDLEADQKIYTKATSRFMGKNELFDLSSKRLMIYIEKLTARAKDNGWNNDVTGITFIPHDPLDAASTLDNLLENYGTIPMERIRAFEETYIHSETRAANDTDMMYKCQIESLSEEAIATLILQKEEYHVGGEPSGNLLLKVIIRESSIDSNASTSIIRTKLSKLAEYMPVVKSNIKEFNTYVQMQLHSLTARGETTNDLLVHLFAAYKVASDAGFRKIALDEEIRYERGETMTAKSLMAFMLSRYEVLMDKQLWDAPSQEEEQLMVMRAELEDLKLEKAGAYGKKKGAKKPAGKSTIVVRKKQAGAKKKFYLDDPDWLTNSVEPKPLTKVMHHRQREWHWCSPATGGKCHGCWRVHKPSECRGPPRDRTEGDNKSNRSSKMISALQSVMIRGEEYEVVEGSDGNPDEMEE